MRRLVKRGARAGVVLGGILLTLAGGWMINGPLDVSATADRDVSFPAGFAAMLCGTLLVAAAVETGRKRERWPYLAVAAAILATAGYNLVTYPPIGDGADFVVRDGNEGGLWPANPLRHMLPFAAIGWALYGALVDRVCGERPPGAEIGLLFRAALFLALALGACLTYAGFVPLLTRAAPLHPAGTLPLAAATAALAGIALPLARRSRAALMVLVMSLSTLAVMLVTWTLWRIPTWTA